MKTIIQTIVITLLVFIAHTGYSQNIWRVNNDDPTANFAQLQELFDDADFQAGDIVYLEGSGKEYAGATVNKKVTIIGPGYLLSDNANTQANTSRASIAGQLVFEVGSENSYLIGVTFDNSNNYYPNIQASNITVQRCYLYGALYITNDISGLVIKQNHIQNVRSFGGNNYDTEDIILTNNIIISNFNIDFNESYRGLSVCENNIFIIPDNVALDIQASSFRNNILLSQTDDVTIISNGGLQNNIAANAQFGAENGNLRASYEDIFVGTGNGRSTDGQYQLKEGSPAIGAGFGGINIGIFGGDDPYVLSGIPPIPAITEIRTSGVGNTLDGLKVNIKVKSN